MDDEVADWLAERAVPVDAFGLAAWRPALAGVRVLGVGAAAAGALELLALGRRLVEYAVEDLGARVVAIGASEAGATLLDAAVRGHGTPDDALAGLGAWEYNAREVAGLVSWLRDVNEMRAPADRVRVVGTDPVWGAPSVRALGGFLRHTAPDLLPDVRDSLADLLDRAPDRKAMPRRVRDDVVGLYERVVADEPRLVAESTPAAYREGRRHAWILARVAEVACAERVAAPRTAAEAEALPATSEPVLRARLAAQAVGQALDETPGPGVTVVFWGHDDLVRVGDPTTVGRHLRAQYDDAYYAVAGLFGHGATSAMRRRLLRPIHPRPSTHRLPVVPGTVETELAAILAEDDGDQLVDLRGALDDEAPAAVADWAETPTSTRRLGPVVDSAQLRASTPLVPVHEYDALAHVRRVSPARIR